ncbi:MAG: (Fe-S)-binding protein [Spirochaetota bacterium]
MTERTPGSEQGLVGGFDLEMVSPPCVPGAAHWSAQARLDADISKVLPYLNARFPEALYDPDAQVLILKKDGKKYAFRPRLISVAPVEDREEAHRLLTGIAGLVNRTWRDRESIQPSWEKKTLPSVMELYRLLPRTNCRQCGYATCMAFAADLREGKTTLSCCPQLAEESHAENRGTLEKLLA